VELHRNAVTVNSHAVVGTLKSGKNRTVVSAAFVVDELAVMCQGKSRDDLIWASRSGGYLPPPSSHDSWLAGCGAALPEGDKAFPRVTAHALRHTLHRWPFRPART
jgi:hypothetical protein